MKRSYFKQLTSVYWGMCLGVRTLRDLSEGWNCWLHWALQIMWKFCFSLHFLRNENSSQRKALLALALRLRRKVHVAYQLSAFPEMSDTGVTETRRQVLCGGSAFWAQRQRKQSLGSGSPVWFWEILTWGARFSPTWVIVSLPMSWIDRIYQRFCSDIWCQKLT